MTQWHTKSKRTKTGAIRTAVRRSDKKLVWRGGDAAATNVSESDRRKVKVTRGSTEKVKQMAVKTVSVTNPKTKKTVKAEIISVEENRANRLFTRRNIVTKGANIKIKLDGKEKNALVTSRPGQKGVVQCILQE